MHTIKEIARLAGVAPATVSRVLNNRPDVKKETKEAVLAVIRDLRYTPNANAKNLKMIATNLICVVVKGTGNLFYVSIVEKMQTHIETYGYTPFVHYIDESDDEIATAKQLQVEKKPLGFIFLGGSTENQREDLTELRTPCVFATTNAAEVELAHVSSVCVDDRRSAQTAVDMLLAHGHRDIVVLGGSLLALDLVHNRYLGVQDSFAAQGLTFSPDRYFECKFSLHSAHRMMRRILAKELHFTAMFAMSDIMAIGAAKAISEHGLRIPQDISVIGFDGIELADYYTPSLATMRQPAPEIAEKSVGILVAQIRGEGGNVHLLLSSEFSQGQSLLTRSAECEGA